MEPETNRRESADQAIWYTGPTWPRKVATKVPLRPSHSLMALSKDALTSHRPSGENCTCAWICPFQPRTDHVVPPPAALKQHPAIKASSAQAQIRRTPEACVTDPHKLSGDTMYRLPHSGWRPFPEASCSHMHDEGGQHVRPLLVDELQVAGHPGDGLLAGGVVRAGCQPLRPAAPGSLIPVMMDKTPLSSTRVVLCRVTSTVQRRRY